MRKREGGNERKVSLQDSLLGARDIETVIIHLQGIYILGERKLKISINKINADTDTYYGEQNIVNNMNVNE